jgi:hypothetical protein
VHEIKEMEKPELNDEFAKAMGFETLAELREDIKTRLNESQESAADHEVEHQIIDTIVDRSKVSRIALTAKGRLLLDAILGEIALPKPISAVSGPMPELVGLQAR